MNSFVLLSKLQLPQINQRVLYRGRLIELLKSNLDKQLILIIAGPGYGKTTLLVQFVHDTGINYVYYHLEKEDSDPAIFIPHLITGVRQIYPEFGEKTMALSNYFSRIDKFSYITLGTLTNEFVEHLTRDLYIILEDYHALKPPSQIDFILNYLFLHAPQKLHFIITSRGDISITTSVLKARDVVFEMRADSFRFTKDEIKALVTTLFSLKLKEDEIEWLNIHSEGWPAGLRLILQSLQLTREIEPSSFITKLQADYPRISANIFDYFAQEVFQYEPKQIQEFLIDCSSAEYLNPNICTIITGMENSKEILADLARRNIFVYSLPDGNYRLHYLFRKFLANKVSDQKKRKELYQRIGDYWLGINKDEAIKYYIQAEDFRKAGEVLQEYGKIMLAQGRGSALSSLIEELPESIYIKNPMLLKLYGQSLSYLGNYTKAKEYLLKALKKSRDRGFKADTEYTIAGVNLNEGDYKSARRRLFKTLKLCPQKQCLIKASALNSLGAIFNSLGGRYLSLAQRFFKRAMRIAEKRNLNELKASILNNWAMNLWKQGDLEGAYSRLSISIKLLKEHFTPGCGAGFYNAARAALLLGYVNQAEEILKSGFEICERFNDPWSLTSIWRGYGLLSLEREELDRAKEYIIKSLELSERLNVPWLIIVALIELCNIEISMGNYLETERCLERIAKIKKLKDDTESIPILLARGRLLVSQKKYEEAINNFLKAIEYAQKFHQIFELFLAKIELAIALFRRNELNNLKKSLKSLIKMSKKYGYGYALIKKFSTEPQLLRYLLKEGIESNYIHSILRKYRQNIHILEAHFFGTSELYVDGIKVKDEDWRLQKAKKLFFYILLNQKTKLNRDTLIERFWPNSGLKQGYDSLRKAVHYIRLTLSKYNIDEPILVQGGYYQLSEKLNVFTDIEEFNEIVNKIKSAETSIHIELPKLLKLYKSGFAPQWYDDWALEMARKYEYVIKEMKERLKAKV
ncbi:MAG: hypothetical protein ABIL70_04435 [candidate division WOR-3 bacterium]